MVVAPATIMDLRESVDLTGKVTAIQKVDIRARVSGFLEAVNFTEGLMDYCPMELIQIQAWGPVAQGKFSGRPVEKEPENVRKTAELVKQMAAAKETTPEAIVLGWLMKHPAVIQPVIGTTNPERIAACQDAERQSQLMTREEWYSLYVSARGENMP